MRTATHDLRPDLTRWGYFFLANLLYALALDCFFLPHRIVAGGFVGIATVLSYMIPLPVGTLTILLNLPFLLWSLLVKGGGYTWRTVFCTFIYGIMVDALAFLPSLTDNILLACLAGGVLYGFAAVCILKSDCSAGGSDLLARLLMCYIPGISLGKMFMAIDGICILFAVITFRDVELGLCGLLALYVYSTCSDQITAGFSKATICYIVTDQVPDELSKHIMLEMRRGVTCQRGTGMFSHEEKNIMMVVLKPREVHKLRTLVKQYDPTAFVVVALASEVQGGGFQARKGSYEQLSSIS